MGIHHNDTKAESMLKLGDFNYYGLAPLNKQYPLKAAQIYKWVEQNTDDAELKGQALFNLGMIYHFGFKDHKAKSHIKQIDINLSQAQKYYSKALKQESNSKTPVYLLYLYSKWQSVDLYEQIFK